MSDKATKKPPRTFPIQRAGRVPWEVAEQAYIGYAKEYGERQTLERLGERGGFGVEEMDRFYPEWRSTTQLIVGLRAENERMKKLGDEFIWGEENPAEYESVMTKLRAENQRMRQGWTLMHRFAMEMGPNDPGAYVARVSELDARFFDEKKEAWVCGHWWPRLYEKPSGQIACYDCEEGL